MPSLLFILALSLCVFPCSIAANGPALFIFGDSSLDVGTNNYINTWAKGNNPPYGIDFPGCIPTGRFSNGFNIADFLAQKLGFKKSPPPFLAIANQSVYLKQIVYGVNFASGGSGILDITGLGSVVPLSEQIQQFHEVRTSLTELLGREEAESLLLKSLIIISTGSNDISGAFLISNSSSNPEFITYLTNSYEDHLKTLYSIGARNFGIVNVAAIGCVPSARVLNNTSGCLAGLNDFALSFDSAIEPMLQNLSYELIGMKYALENAYKVMISILNNPRPLGLADLKTACCGGGKLNAQQLCTQNATVCENRREYFFWDPFHATEGPAALFAEALYSGTPEFVTPINIKQLNEYY